MGINKRLLPIKGHYFFKNAATAPILPFIPVIAKDLGFSGTAVGSVLTVVPLLTLLVKPIVGAIADKFGAHKFLYAFFLVSNALLFMTVQFLPSLPKSNSVVLKCDQTADVVVTSEKSSDHCFVKRLRTLMDSTPLQSEMRCSDTADILNTLNGHKTYWNDNELNSSLDVGISFPLIKEENHIYLKIDYLTSNGKKWEEPVCSEPVEWNCTLESNNPMIHDMVNKPLKGFEVYRSWPFWAFAIVVILGKMSEETFGTMGDTISLKVLGDKRNDIGLQMLWGAVPWGLISFGTGLIVDITSANQPIKDFSFAYYISAVLFAMNLIVCFFFDLKEDEIKEKSAHIFRDVRKQLFGQPKFLVFLCCVVFSGACSALVWNYLFWFIEEISSEDGCSDATWVKTLDGLSLCVHCFVGEIPFFFISGWMLKTFGYAHCMSIVLLGFGLRFILYYFLTNVWWILPIESLNGVTYATLFSTMMTYASAISPPGTEATVQGIVSAFFEGIGICIGSLLGGIFIDTWGIRLLFLIVGLTSMSLAVIHSALHIGWDVKSEKYKDRKLPPEQFEYDPSYVIKDNLEEANQ